MDDATFLARFEGGTYPLDAWNHRCHIKAAYLYLTRHELPAAIDRMRAAIRAYNAANRVPDGPTMGYHETITQAWMRLVHTALAQTGSVETADAFCDANPALLDKRLLLNHYSRDRIMSARAKRTFIPPDLNPLPQPLSDPGTDPRPPLSPTE